MLARACPIIAFLLLLPSDRVAAADWTQERRCLALIAYAEATGEGEAGMAAVIRVVQNRMADPRFPKKACAVVAQDGQFQPIAMSPRLAAALDDEARDLADALRVDTARERSLLDQAGELAGQALDADPTGGAVFFVNPFIMDPANCSWFARLKRTATIGAHVFMTHYAADEPRQAPAIDCSTAGAGFRSWLRSWNQGVMAPGRPKIASITPTSAMLKKWKASGRLEARQLELRRRVGKAFKRLD
ncbi:MAG TPA: cell wall hydrolase [Geminicoccus sp.]|jgi:hypothetical protein|uniref:cell wall hydrolase n=1 Tax=Geminicoccus sp. TaxID=2024832 RepID=UPI002E36B718|nr:cell wall hydrolase [Geminicoccus sp.]HEX2527353.1 cell wall hydrolase [Geminicoccus sp.]